MAMAKGREPVERKRARRMRRGNDGRPVLAQVREHQQQHRAAERESEHAADS